MTPHAHANLSHSTLSHLLSSFRARHGDRRRREGEGGSEAEKERELVHTGGGRAPLLLVALSRQTRRGECPG